MNNSAFVCNEVYKLYKGILNSYVSDFYLENHWDQRLPTKWKLFLENLSFSEIAQLLDYEKPSKLASTPLTILCLQKILQSFCITRRQAQNLRVHSKSEPKFLNFFWKNVKLKKRHEIELMSQVCYQTALKANCFNIVDIGSGLGHLSRMLAYQYGFRVCTIEANENLTRLAPKLDLQFEKMLCLKKIPYINIKQPIHIHRRIEDSLSSEEFNTLVREAIGSNNTDFKFGIIGLHPCGNLGATLLRLFRECPNAAFINIVSCCYMKLSLDPFMQIGFPLSSFYKQNHYKLDYLACEAACHAIENYIDKIKSRDYYKLKIHSLRAALEMLLVQVNESFKHCAVGNVKYDVGMTFREYCHRALGNRDIKLRDGDINKYETVVEGTWKKVLKFYSIRLLSAPVVESLILYDRLLYLQECKSICDILPVFDCQISPRNHVLSSTKIL